MKKKFSRRKNKIFNKSIKFLDKDFNFIIFIALMVLVFSFIFSFIFISMKPVEKNSANSLMSGHENEVLKHNEGLISQPKKSSGSFFSTGIWSTIIGLFSNPPETDIKISKQDLGPGFNDMSIESVSSDIGEISDEITIITTGARYVLKNNELLMYRRIDPETNDFNELLVSRLAFSSNLHSMKVEDISSTNVNISSEQINFEFFSDSFFIAKSNQDFTYTYNNFFQNPVWMKNFGDLKKIWANSGGNLYINISGIGSALTIRDDATDFESHTNDKIGFMVFPPKVFDFDGLYGSDSKPFVQFISSESELDEVIDGTKIDDYKNNHFGVFVVNPSLIYKNDAGDSESPILLDSTNIDYLDSNVMGYEINPTKEQKFEDFITKSHEEGFKVITYLKSPFSEDWEYPAGHINEGQIQDISITLDWMKKFQENYHSDGWFIDNFNSNNVLGYYNFIKTLRKNVDEEAETNGFNKGVIYQNESSDVAGGSSGFRSVMIDAYADYILAGDTEEISGPNDVYFGYYGSGYGLSQAYGSDVLDFSKKVVLSKKEKQRVMVDLNNIEINLDDDFVNYYLPYYEERKQSYLSGDFQTKAWPIDNQSGWFREPQNLEIEKISKTSYNISWETDEPTTTSLKYTTNGVFFVNDSSKPEGVLFDRSFKTKHDVVLKSLNPNNDYSVMIRSDNENESNEIIYGTNLSLSTESSEDAICGNNFCEQGETYTNCPEDCFNGMIYYYSMDYDGLWNQAIPDDETAIPYNTKFNQDSFVGESCKFDGDGSYIEIPWNSNLDELNDNDELTISLWAKSNVSFSEFPSETPYNVKGLWQIYKSPEERIYARFTKTDYGIRVYNDINNVGDDETFGTLGVDISEWNHYAFVFNGNELKFYLNGELFGTNTLASTISDLDDGFRIRIGYGYYDYRSWNGSIDDFKIFNRALSDGEIAEIAENSCGDNKCSFSEAIGSCSEDCPSIFNNDDFDDVFKLCQIRYSDSVNEPPLDGVEFTVGSQTAKYDGLPNYYYTSVTNMYNHVSINEDLAKSNAVILTDEELDDIYNNYGFDDGGEIHVWKGILQRLEIEKICRQDFPENPCYFGAENDSNMRLVSDENNKPIPTRSDKDYQDGKTIVYPVSYSGTGAFARLFFNFHNPAVREYAVEYILKQQERSNFNTLFMDNFLPDDRLFDGYNYVADQNQMSVYSQDLLDVLKEVKNRNPDTKFILNGFIDQESKKNFVDIAVQDEYKDAYDIIISENRFWYDGSNISFYSEYFNKIKNAGKMLFLDATASSNGEYYSEFSDSHSILPYNIWLLSHLLAGEDTYIYMNTNPNDVMIDYSAYHFNLGNVISDIYNVGKIWYRRYERGTIVYDTTNEDLDDIQFVEQGCSEEVCDNYDNDCDGEVNEGGVCDEIVCGNNICEDGENSLNCEEDCGSGGGSSSSGSGGGSSSSSSGGGSSSSGSGGGGLIINKKKIIKPGIKTEICDGKDNDGDLMVDENNADCSGDTPYCFKGNCVECRNNFDCFNKDDRKIFCKNNVCFSKNENPISPKNNQNKFEGFIGFFKNTWIYFVIFIFAVLIGVVLFFIIKNFKENIKPKNQPFFVNKPVPANKKININKSHFQNKLILAKKRILEMRNKGYSDDFIKKLFLDKGWNKQQIENILKNSYYKI